MTTEEECDFLRGYYHANYTLCSQVGKAGKMYCGHVTWWLLCTGELFAEYLRA